jgi:wyosine [tRNA(Phe)-imidazoG37] synthetase (radical SAM superfamily)
MSRAGTELFKQHTRHWRQNKYVYPVISRRSRGLSMGVNLNPDTVCNFDCIYCCVDRTVPPAVRNVDLDVVGSELDQLLVLAASGELFNVPPLSATPHDLRRLNDVAFSGDGEPTAFGRFREACGLVANLLEKHGLPDTKIVVISNATLLTRQSVVDSLEFLDRHNGEVWAKLDAGTQAYYERVERTSIPLSRVLANIAAAGRHRPLVIQSLFMKIDGRPPPEEEISAYINRVRELVAEGCRIKLVQVYTTAREPAEAFVTPLDVGTLGRVAEQLRSIPVAVEVYGAPE